MLKIWFRGAIVSAALWIAAGMAAARHASAYMIEMLTVTLPHSVSVGEATLPAGEYTIRTDDLGSSSPVLIFQSENGAAAVVPAMKIARPSSDAGKKAGLVIEHHGDAYRLAKVWLDGHSGYWLAPYGR